MRYLPAFDIWQVPTELLSHAQPGQWVYAGDKESIGRFYGVKKSGSVVVAWRNNALNSGSPKEYYSALRMYAKG